VLVTPPGRPNGNTILTRAFMAALAVGMTASFGCQDPA
jgi:hypothetical protein